MKKFDGINKIKHLNRVLKSKIIHYENKLTFNRFRLIGNAILITAFLSYCGPFNQEFRQRMLNEWQKQIQQRLIPYSENFNLIEQLNDEATVKDFFQIQFYLYINRSVNGIYMVYQMMIYQFKMVLLLHRTIVIHF